VLLQSTRDIQCNQTQASAANCDRQPIHVTRSRTFQITKLRLRLSEKEKELERVVVDAGQRYAERERAFEQQVFEYVAANRQPENAGTWRRR
jgi:hypothetical protein